jgi:hypothetical protein
MDHRKRRAYVTILWKSEATFELQNVPMAKPQLFTADLVFVILYRQQSDEKKSYSF